MEHAIKEEERLIEIHKILSNRQMQLDLYVKLWKELRGEWFNDSQNEPSQELVASLYGFIAIYEPNQIIDAMFMVLAFHYKDKEDIALDEFGKRLIAIGAEDE